jgi:outer membrane protein W
MKKTYLILSMLVFVFLASELKAQNTRFKPFKVDIAAGYGLPSGAGSKGGIVLALEPKYAVNEKFTIGLRLEGSASSKTIKALNGNILYDEVKVNRSALLTGDYFIQEGSNLRPFIGLGVGIYDLAALEFDNFDKNSTLSISGVTKLGFAPRVGIETGHFRAAAEYNIAGKYNNINHDYLAIKVGFFIGGGKK